MVSQEGFLEESRESLLLVMSLVHLIDREAGPSPQPGPGLIPLSRLFCYFCPGNS